MTAKQLNDRVAALEKRAAAHAEIITGLRTRLNGHADLITFLHARLKEANPRADPIPRIYLPLLETFPRPKVMTMAHAKAAAQKRRRA